MREQKIPVQVFADGALLSGVSQALTACAQRPLNQKWAVLLEGAPMLVAAPQGVVLRQLVSGCLCCAGQLVLRTSVAQMIRLEKPDRLLIEIANPQHRDSLLALLRSATFAQHLEIQD